MEGPHQSGPQDVLQLTFRAQKLDNKVRTFISSLSVNWERFIDDKMHTPDIYTISLKSTSDILSSYDHMKFTLYL